MKIVLYEMKKIWNIKLLSMITILCALFFFMFMSFYIKYFPNGHPATEEIDYSIQMTRQYGRTLEPEEYEEFIVKNKEEVSAQIETYIKNNDIFSAAGIYSFADYEKVYEKDNPTQLEMNALNGLSGKESGFLLYKIQTLDSIEERYLARLDDNLNEKEQMRLTEIQYAEKYNNIMSEQLFDNTVMYSIYFAILAVLSVLLFLAPLITTDRSRNLHLLQYTSKNGRKTFNYQFAAVILSAFLLTTALLFIFGLIYSTNGTMLFMDNGLISFLNSFLIFWLDITYRQYITLYIIFLYILCLGTAGIAFILSRYSQNLIALILKLIPVTAALWVLCFSIFYNMFTSSNPLYKQTKIFGIEPVVCSLILIAGLVASFYTVHRERKIDIL